jgi:hypothetical protein
MILFADFLSAETTWAHIQAVPTVIETYGAPRLYYVDSLRSFQFMQGQDSFWHRDVLQIDDVYSQRGRMMALPGIDVTFARSANNTWRTSLSASTG